MKNKKFTRILILLTIVALLLPAGSAYAADVDGEEHQPDPQTVTTISYSFTTSSDIVGDAYIYAVSSGIASYITSKITLQSAPLGSSSYPNVSGVTPSTYTVYNRSSIAHLCSFPVSSTRNYRIKIELTDEVNDKTATVTRYKNLTRI